MKSGKYTWEWEFEAPCVIVCTSEDSTRSKEHQIELGKSQGYGATYAYVLAAIEEGNEDIMQCVLPPPA